MHKCEADIDALKRDMQRCRPGTSQHNMYKRRLLQAMRERKRIDQQLSAQAGFESNLSAVQDARYQMQDASQMAAALKASGQELKASQGAVNVDEIENIQDDITDILVETNDVQEALGRDYGVDGIDDAELESELQSFEQEMGYSTGAYAAETPSYLMPTPHASSTPYSSTPHIPARSYEPPNPR